MRSAAKADLRVEILERRRALPAAERRARSARIARRLFGLDVWDDARLVHLYVGALDGEVETREIAREAWGAGKRVACPVVRWDPPGLDHHELVSLDELVAGPLGLWQPDPGRSAPVDPAAIDLVVVPGIAFDRRGHRLGYGAGFYDRFLAAVAAPAVGLAFSLQIVEAVPYGPHDVPVDRVVTEDETIDCRAVTRPPEPQDA